jgi:hypothetical protein
VYGAWNKVVEEKRYLIQGIGFKRDSFHTEPSGWLAGFYLKHSVMETSAMHRRVQEGVSSTRRKYAYHRCAYFLTRCGEKRRRRSFKGSREISDTEVSIGNKERDSPHPNCPLAMLSFP